MRHIVFLPVQDLRCNATRTHMLSFTLTSLLQTWEHSIEIVKYILSQQLHSVVLVCRKERRDSRAQRESHDAGDAGAEFYCT